MEKSLVDSVPDPYSYYGSRFESKPNSHSKLDHDRAPMEECSDLIEPCSFFWQLFNQRRLLDHRRQGLMLIYLFFGGRGGSNIIRCSTCRKESRERGQRSKGGCSIHNTSWLVGQMLETSSRGRAYPSNLSINGSILKFNSRGRILLLFQPGPVKSFKGLLL